MISKGSIFYGYFLASTLYVLWTAAPAQSFSPTKEVIEKCYSNKSIPTHFKQADYVVAASFEDHTADHTLSSYAVQRVWKGDIKTGARISILTPPSIHGPDYLKLATKSYLFFLKRNDGLPSSSNVFRRITCYFSNPIELSNPGPNDQDRIKILNQESEQNHAK